jgi:hypothetical protein
VTERVVVPFPGLTGPGGVVTYYPDPS